MNKIQKESHYYSKLLEVAQKAHQIPLKTPKKVYKLILPYPIAIKSIVFI